MKHLSAIPERYHIEELLRQHPMSVTYRATDLENGDKLVLKAVRYPYWFSVDERTDHRQRAAACLRAAADARHTAAAMTHSVCEQEAGLVLIREWAPGSSLSEVLADQGRIAPGEVARIARGVAGALDALADLELSHGGVSLENIIVSPEGSVKLTDAVFASEATRFVVAGASCRLADRRISAPDISALADTLLTALGGQAAEVRKDPVSRRMVSVLKRARKDGRTFATAASLAEALTELSSAAIVQQVWRPATTSGLFAAFATVCVLAVSDERPRSSAAARENAGVITAAVAEVPTLPLYEDLTSEEKSWLALEIRRLGVGALARPTVAEAFGLDAIQKAAVHSILAQHRGHLADVLEKVASVNPSTPKAGGRAILYTGAVRGKTVKSALGVLRPAQRELWRSLAGQTPAEGEPVL